MLKTQAVACLISVGKCYIRMQLYISICYIKWLHIWRRHSVGSQNFPFFVQDCQHKDFRLA